jgi:hypothetical protein
MRKAKQFFVALLPMMMLPSAAIATEAVMGRYIPGAFAAPMAGILPPEGVYWSSNTLFYTGSAGANLQVPVAGTVRLGLEATLVGENFTVLWVPGIEIAPDTQFGISVTLPVMYADVGVTLGGLRVGQSQTAIGDIMVAPTIGWHSGTTFVTASVRIYAPTGAYDVGALDNVGMNYWTFSPTLAFTHIDPERGLDFSATLGIDINTVNPDTGYYSGAMLHLDASVMKNVTEAFAVGIFGSILYQIEDDRGGNAAQSDGFRGQSFAIGPIIKYTAGSKERPINMTLSWAPEFGTKNRLRGNGVYLGISGKF